jgi:hypothetical protein
MPAVCGERDIPGYIKTEDEAIECAIEVAKLLHHERFQILRQTPPWHSNLYIPSLFTPASVRNLRREYTVYNLLAESYKYRN